MQQCNYLHSLAVKQYVFKQIAKISGLNKCVNLKALILNNNQITEIQNIKNLTQINTLILSNNQLKEIKNINHLKDLEKL